ncbi:MAG: hypothetical protein KJP00_03495 [Bacteroidia bacterium]|nr:hypothetical protein [Bacteroidia bacterium]
MDSVISKVQNIELKVKKLTLLLEQYKTDCALLNEENQRLKQNLAKHEGNTSEPKAVESALYRSSIPQSAPARSEKETEALKAKFDRYIKEVDKCIEIVNNW